MNFYTLFYLMALGDKLSTLFGWITVIFTVFLIVFGLLTHLWEGTREDNLVYNAIVRTYKFSIVLCPIFWILYVGTPDKKEATLILVGGYVGNFIQNDTGAKRLPSDVVNFLRVQLNTAAKEAQIELQQTITGNPVDTLKDKSKEELIEFIKQAKQ